MGRSEQAGDDGIGNLILKNIWRLSRPTRVHNHLNVGDIWQRIQRHMLERPDASQCEHQYDDENHEAISCAEVNDPREHSYIPPSAFMRNCFVASRVSPCLTTIVNCQSPPLG